MPHWARKPADSSQQSPLPIAQIYCHNLPHVASGAGTPLSTRISAKRSGPPRVALLIETSNAYGRGLLAGVAEYVQMHGPWSVYLPETGRADGSAATRLRGWRGDGVLVRAEDHATARAANLSESAIVDLSAAGLLQGRPAVHSDLAAEADAGFDHLWDRGYRHMGFCGVSQYAWVRRQQKAFCRRAGEAGADVSVFLRTLRLTRAKGWAADRAALAAWLRTLPRPVGIFACYDLLGQLVLDACRLAGLRIPDDVAVIGVDDDAVRCSLSDPPLSSVAPDTRLIGYRAAELLAAIMAGRRVEAGMRLVPPLGVSARRSTEALAVPDMDVAAALRFIRDHCCESIGVSDVVSEVALSRRVLESRFVRHVGRTPHAEIQRCRMEIAKQLLADTDLPVKSIATRVGAGTPEYLSVLFQKTLATTPSAYRAGRQPGRTAVIRIATSRSSSRP